MIEVENLNVNFGKNIIFKDFNITLEDNNIIGISATGGTGKSKLVNYICSILKPDLVE